MDFFYDDALQTDTVRDGSKPTKNQQFRALLGSDSVTNTTAFGLVKIMPHWNLFWSHLLSKPSQKGHHERAELGPTLLW